MLITYNGEKRWPDKITPYSPPPPPKKDVEEVITKSEEEILAEKNAEQLQSFVQNTSIATLAAAALLAFGITSDSPDAVSLMSTFALAGLAGYQVRFCFTFRHVKRELTSLVWECMHLDAPITHPIFSSHSLN